jgi:hypothetical protein
VYCAVFQLSLPGCSQIRNIDLKWTKTKLCVEQAHKSVVVEIGVQDDRQRALFHAYFGILSKIIAFLELIVYCIQRSSETIPTEMLESSNSIRRAEILEMIILWIASKYATIRLVHRLAATQ